MMLSASQSLSVTKPYDAEVEWLAAQNDAYIDTGVGFADQEMDEIEFSIQADIIISGTPTGTFYVIGGGHNVSNVYNINTSTTNLRVGRNNSGITSIAFNDLQNTIIHCGISGDGSGNLASYINSTQNTASYVSMLSWREGVTFLVFARMIRSATQTSPSIYIGSNGSQSCVRLLSLSIDTQTEHKKFIPVIKNGLGYLYDELNPFGGPNGNGLYGTPQGSFLTGSVTSV